MWAGKTEQSQEVGAGLLRFMGDSLLRLGPMGDKITL